MVEKQGLQPENWIFHILPTMTTSRRANGLKLSVEAAAASQAGVGERRCRSSVGRWPCMRGLRCIGCCRRISFFDRFFNFVHHEAIVLECERVPAALGTFAPPPACRERERGFSCDFDAFTLIGGNVFSTEQPASHSLPHINSHSPMGYAFYNCTIKRATQHHLLEDSKERCIADNC